MKRSDLVQWVKITLASTKVSPSKSTEGASNQVMMSTGASSDQYQTVTIVPSDGDTGEVRKEFEKQILHNGQNTLNCLVFDKKKHFSIVFRLATYWLSNNQKMKNLAVTKLVTK